MPAFSAFKSIFKELMLVDQTMIRYSKTHCNAVNTSSMRLIRVFFRVSRLYYSFNFNQAKSALCDVMVDKNPT